MSRLNDRDFFFVHRHNSCQSPSRSGSKERSQILRHVRRRAVVQKPWMDYATVLDIAESSSGLTHRSVHTIYDAPTNALDKCANYSDYEDQREEKVSWIQTFNHNKTVYTFLSTMWPSFNSSDPFHCTAGGSAVTNDLHLIGKSVGNQIYGTTFNTEVLKPPMNFEARKPVRHDQARLERMQACVRDELLLYSSIAHGSSSEAWKRGYVDDSRSQFWIGKTLQALRSRLATNESSDDDGVVLSIFTLTLTALWNGIPRMWLDDLAEIDASRFNDCQTHIRAMLILIEKVGGWHQFSPYILEGMILADKYTALYALTPPLIPLTFDPSVESLNFPASQVPAQSVIPDMATGFQELDIDTELKKILQDVGTFYHAAAGIWQVKVQLSSQQEHIIYCRFQALHYRLLLLQTTNWTSELVRRTTLLSLCNITLYAAGLIFTRVMLHHLYQAMTVAGLRDKNIDYRIWQWCLCTGATTKLPTNEKSWFIHQLHQCLTDVDSHANSSALPQLMTKYIYIPWLQDAQLRAITDPVEVEEKARQDLGIFEQENQP